MRIWEIFVHPVRKPSSPFGLRVSLFLLGVPFFLGCPLLDAQVFQLQGGASSLFQAQGGSLDIRAPGYEARFGVGNLNGFRLGVSLRTQWRGYALGFGDDTIPFRMPTDVFDTGHYFLGRGMSLATLHEKFSAFGFAGTTATGFAAPYFRGARAEGGVGLLFVDYQLSPTLRTFSRNVLSGRQTTIHGLEWQVSPGIRTSIAGGVGSNQPYYAASLIAEREWVNVKAGYVGAGSQFRRIAVQTPLSPESDRENILITIHPKSYLSFAVGRQNLLQPPSLGAGQSRASVNQYLASLRLAGVGLSGAVFDSRWQGSRNTGTSISASRNITRFLQANINYLESRPARGPKSTTWVSTFREIISPRLSLVQLFTRSNGQTSMSLGGNLISNRISVGVEYQTVYVPFVVGNQFKQALVLNLRFQPFGNVQVNAGTYVAPDGSIKYTAYGGTFLYRGVVQSAAPAGISLHRYVVSGRVMDEEGKPFRGAALRIDGEVTFSNSQGVFEVRKKKLGPYRLQVLTSEFLVPGRFEVVSAPSTVRAELDERKTWVAVVVRRSGSLQY
jgi:hypothetical protein